MRRVSIARRRRSITDGSDRVIWSLRQDDGGAGLKCYGADDHLD